MGKLESKFEELKDILDSDWEVDLYCVSSKNEEWIEVYNKKTKQQVLLDDVDGVDEFISDLDE